MADVLANWTHNPNQANSGVNFEPLQRGQWEDQFWKDNQEARCSNNRKIQAPVGGMNAIKWVVESATDEPNDIFFNVSIDLPGGDPIAWEDQGNNSVIAIAPLPLGLLWADANQRGFYIASVRGATGSFTVMATSSKQ
jgi:hypothetical protein